MPFSFLTFRGDYRTGKRLNMRKVIPYIASQFRKDKIWLRRTKPSKRQYQICLAIDDSSSMIDNHSKQVKRKPWKDYKGTVLGWCAVWHRSGGCWEGHMVVLWHLFFRSVGLNPCDFMPKRFVAKRSVTVNWKKEILHLLDKRSAHPLKNWFCSLQNAEVCLAGQD